MRFARSPLPALAAALLGWTLVPGPARADTSPPAVNESYQVPPSGVYTIQGHGFGHGHGLSQWGAYGAAKVADLSSNQILHFYYPHTTLATKPVTQEVRVLLTAAAAPSKGYLEFEPAAGLTVAPQTGDAIVLPEQTDAGDPIDLWRLRKSAATISLRAHSAKGWSVVKPDVGVVATISDPDALIAVVQPNGATTKTIRYRGQLVAQLQSAKLQVVNDVLVESYLRSVVPSEMPRTWTAAALQAQAVAARTYTWRALASPKAAWYDIDGDTRDQAYGGLGAESTKTDAAIHATAGEVIVDSTGAAIFAQYSSADGGWTVSGGQSYLPAKRDPYDGAVPNGSHSWSTTIPATAIAAAYPSVGTVQRLVITGRDGHGAWGGRVTSISVVGSDATKTLTGSGFAGEFGLRSTWFRAMPAPGAPTAVAASASGHTVTVTWKAPSPISGAAAVTGYRVVLSPGRQVVNTDASTLTASFTGVKPGDYTASVAAKSAAGRGASGSDAVTVKAL
ncbi:MAG TPA: SpoIID/LytB domain-containing protein [Mycobacteriales bacterium]|nr:SpoIID/LytB domain-containing protein [Mycobacteriales bacterium]